LNCVDSNRMLNHKDDELIDGSRLNWRISHDMQSSSRYSIFE
jgi:hypothetical protein